LAATLLNKIVEDRDDPGSRRISYALTEAMNEGHCGLPTDQLVSARRPLSKPFWHSRSEKVRLLLCAPTGRAAKRMTEATGFK
jgi:hypothetical protein